MFGSRLNGILVLACIFLLNRQAGASSTIAGFDEVAATVLANTANGSANHHHFVKRENVRFGSVAVLATRNDVAVEIAGQVAYAVKAHAGFRQIALAVSALHGSQSGVFERGEIELDASPLGYVLGAGKLAFGGASVFSPSSPIAQLATVLARTESVHRLDLLARWASHATGCKLPTCLKFSPRICTSKPLLAGFDASARLASPQIEIELGDGFSQPANTASSDFLFCHVDGTP